MTVPAITSAQRVGELYLADIGVPRAIHRKFGLEVGPIFTAQDMIRIR